MLAHRPVLVRSISSSVLGRPVVGNPVYPVLLAAPSYRLLSTVQNDSATTLTSTSSEGSPVSLGGAIRSVTTAVGLGENQFATGGIAVTLVAAIVASVKVFTDLAVDFISKKIIVKAEFDSRDESFNWLLTWLAENKYSKKCNHFAVSTRIARPGEGQDELVNGMKPVYFLPSPGMHFFFFKGRLLWLSRERLNQQQISSNTINERIVISTFGRSSDVLKELTLDARRVFTEKDQARTIIYSADQYGNWRRSRSLPKRELESVILEKNVKMELVADAEEFLRSEKWYAGLGIPYRRGYLLYGPPGTGKTSFVTALAGHLNLNIYNVNLSNKALTDATLTDLLIELPPRCVLLIEDIHAVFSDSDNIPSNPNLTLSGILNVVDGVSATEGRLLFLTTNRVNLDKALIRPGRVDVKAYLGNATSTVIESIFIRFYSRFTSTATLESDYNIRDKSCHVSIVNKPVTMEKLNALASQFVQKIPEGKFSPALIIGYLMKFKTSAFEAVDNVEMLWRMEQLEDIEDPSNIREGVE